ncbi:MAG: Thiamine precursor transporter HmpT [Peptostreptococcus russellii]
MSSHTYEANKFQTKDFVICGILMALTTIMTMIVQIPVVGAHGYVNMGDTVVLFSGLYLGKKHGGIIGGVGSALADVILGYAIYAPVTLVAKGLEGFLCGLIAEKVSGKKGNVIGTIIGGIVMVSGYFIGEIFMYGIQTSLAAVPANSLQATFGIVTSLLIYTAVKRSLDKSRI